MKTLGFVISIEGLFAPFIVFVVCLLVGIALLNSFFNKTKVPSKLIGGVSLLVVVLVIVGIFVKLWVNYPPRRIELLANEVALSRIGKNVYRHQADATVFTDETHVIFPNNGGISHCDIEIKLSPALEKIYKNHSVVFKVYFNYFLGYDEYYFKILKLIGPDGRFTENLYHKVSAYADKYELTGKDCSWEMEMQKYLSPYVEKLGPQLLAVTYNYFDSPVARGPNAEK